MNIKTVIMQRRPPLVLVLVVLAFLAAAWLVACGVNAFNLASSSSQSGSGVIQTDEYIVATEAAGRVTDLLAEEGDQVHAGQVLAKLDATLLAAQVEQADAALAMAQANLSKLQAGARPEELAQAKAVLAQAVAKRDGAKTALDDAKVQQRGPQDLNARINNARAALTAAEHRALGATYVAQAATLEREFYQRTLDELEQGIQIQTPFGVITRSVGAARLDDLRTQLALAVSKEWGAWAAQGSAAAQRDGLRADLNNLLAVKSDPLTLEAQVDAARAQLDAAEAGVQVAQAKLDALQGGSRTETISVAQAQVAQAQAVRDALKSQLNKMALTAPNDGMVVQKFLHVGEMATPGSSVYHITNLDAVTLTIYIPEDQIGKVKLGARADVQVDSFPGRIYTGSVYFISPQAEFTPKNIATKDQRSTQVFAVKVRIQNSDHTLKSGMPADGTIK